MGSLTLACAVAREASRHARLAFGVMGDGNAHLIDALICDGVAYVAMRHEAGAVAAADIHFRATRSLAIATSTYGAGFTNTLTPLAEAVKARVPLLLLAGAHGADRALWDVDEVALAESLGAAAFRIDEPRRATATVRAAAETALATGCPAVVLLPSHLLGEVATPPLPGPAALRPAPIPAVEPAIAEELASRLLEASSPLILGGRGVWLSDAGAAWREIAELTGAHLATTAAARRVFGHTDRDLGISGGFAPDPTAEAIEDADLVIVAGAGLNPFTTRFGDAFGGRVVHTDADPTRFHPWASEKVHAEAGQLAAAILRELRAHLPGAGPLPPAHPARPPRGGFPEFGPDGRLDPRSAAIALEPLLPAQRQVVSDGGHFVSWPAEFWDVPDPAAFLQIGTAYKAVGLGVPGAVGAAWARRDRTTVLVTGDGGLAMCLADFPCLVEAPGRKIVVVFNDSAYGAELHQFGPHGLNVSPATFPEWDVAQTARSFGAAGITATALDSLTEVGTWAQTHETGTLVVDLKVSREVQAAFIGELYRLKTKQERPTASP